MTESHTIKELLEKLLSNDSNDPLDWLEKEISKSNRK